MRTNKTNISSTDPGTKPNAENNPHGQRAAQGPAQKQHAKTETHQPQPLGQEMSKVFSLVNARELKNIAVINQEPHKGELLHSHHSR